MHATLPLLLETDFPAIRREPLETLQVNLGYLCNQSCLHCHVNAGPRRTEVMSTETVDAIICFLQDSPVTTLDLTGGAPELNPSFRRLVNAARALDIAVIDRCNLTVLLEPEQRDTDRFLARNKVKIVASLPCYIKDNVDAQRGNGAFDGSIKALRRLNRLGYGEAGFGLELDLVYNPQGAVLPPPQQALEQDYRAHLETGYGIRFNRLRTLTNMPIKRFGSTLVSQGRFADYMRLLRSTHQDSNLDSVMCRSLLSVDWQGYLYDCDFNQMLDMPLQLHGRKRLHISGIRTNELAGAAIRVADHCYGCTAGQGSSCGGALDTGLPENIRSNG
ncbi:MAG TPA: arsenosugar biosynthesis radical SAM (seleno)protein ArsS [Gammaproteobacteria bacterium]|nr:arsenosugar biosynthesis radical SAM (seleno)protein ArsS [Gammaproteobacteria bacterium]